MRSSPSCSAHRGRRVAGRDGRLCVRGFGADGIQIAVALSRRRRGVASRPPFGAHTAAPCDSVGSDRSYRGPSAATRERSGHRAWSWPCPVDGGCNPARIGLGWLSSLDLRPPVQRYERQNPGELIHVDTKKLGRIDGIGHRITGSRVGQRRQCGTGWECCMSPSTTPPGSPTPRYCRTKRSRPPAASPVARWPGSSATAYPSSANRRGFSVRRPVAFFLRRRASYSHLDHIPGAELRWHPRKHVIDCPAPVDLNSLAKSVSLPFWRRGYLETESLGKDLGSNIVSGPFNRGFFDSRRALETRKERRLACRAALEASHQLPCCFNSPLTVCLIAYIPKSSTGEDAVQH